MYVIVKNSSSVIPHSLNKHTWKYLEECQEFAEKQVSLGDVVEICELTPRFTYNYTLEVEETPEHVCGTPEDEENEPSEEEPIIPKPDENPGNEQEGE